MSELETDKFNDEMDTFGGEIAEVLDQTSNRIGKSVNLSPGEAQYFAFFIRWGESITKLFNKYRSLEKIHSDYVIDTRDRITQLTNDLEIEQGRGTAEQDLEIVGLNKKLESANIKLDNIVNNDTRSTKLLREIAKGE